MKSALSIMTLVAAIIAVAEAPAAFAQDFYYSGDSIYQLVQSNTRIAVQYDTTRPTPDEGQFTGAHPCLNAAVPVEYLARGFRLFGIQSSCGYTAAAASLVSDPVVHRALPVYRAVGDSADLPVTDMVSVRFDAALPTDSALTLLVSYGLRFLDSSAFRHNLWRCALADSITESPVAYANTLHLAPGVLWACPSFFIRPVPASGPTDPYYTYQYYLKNTGQNGGVAGVDINVEPAWQVPLTNPNLVVAVVDMGLNTHTELSWPRLRPGYDFAGNCLSCNPPSPPDNDPTPGTRQGHGMACAGILAASHNGTGVAGVFGTCKVVPIKIYDDAGNASGDFRVVVDAIYYAQMSGARVISNSWSYPSATPIQEVADAIRDVSNGRPRPPGAEKEPEAALGSVFVFAAGNHAALGIPVEFPANMPEVIAVGAVHKSGPRWGYSCYGSALDVMAPSGNTNLQGDQWTVDQMGDLGWNPHVTGAGDAHGDQNYTSAMGGTSGACPQVAGIAALLMARGHADISPYHPYEKIREIIIRTATDMGTAGWDQYYGYGRANAYRAMLSIIHGDVNNDGVIDAADVIMMINIAFSGGSAVLDDGTADVNCDGGVDVFDVIQIIAVAFSGGLAPICYY